MTSLLGAGGGPAGDGRRRPAVRVPADLPRSSRGHAPVQRTRSGPCMCRRGHARARHGPRLPRRRLRARRADRVPARLDLPRDRFGGALSTGPRGGGMIRPGCCGCSANRPASRTARRGWATRPPERLANLRRRSRPRSTCSGRHHDDQLAQAIIEVAFLGDAAPHEAVARQLHLSRSAYFRRLNAATDRVGEGTRRPRAPPLITTSRSPAKSGGSHHWICETAPLALLPGLFAGLPVHVRFDRSAPPGLLSCPIHGQHGHQPRAQRTWNNQGETPA